MRANTLMPIMNFMTRFYRSFISPRRQFSANILKLITLLFFTGILFYTSSCEKGATKIGSGLLPGNDFVTIKSTDSMTVKSFTLFTDSVPTAEPSISFLGTAYNPYFGTTTAGFVSQLRLEDSLTDVSFYVIDSINLYLKFLTVRGDVSGEHYLRLSEISNEIYVDTVYYSNAPVPLTGYVVDNIPLPALKADTINSVTVNVPKSFAEYLMRDQSMLFLSDSKPDFRSFFKGLYVQLLSPDNPLMVSVSLAPPGSAASYSNYFSVFMHDEYGNTNTYSFLLDANVTNASYNVYQHDFTTAETGKKIQHINDYYADTLSYAENMNGLFTRIEFPSLPALKKDPALSKIAVNKARLIIPVVYDGINYIPSTIPTILYLRYLTTTGKKYIVPDYSSVSATFYDGTPDTTVANAYNLNIATFLQDYLDDTADTIKPELELFVADTSKYDVILKANKSYKPVKFQFTYTKF